MTACQEQTPNGRTVDRRVETVLSVDDNEGVRYVRRRVLEKAGYRVVEAADGAEALRLAESETPSLILLDIRLPDFDGFTVCERLKASDRTASTPVVHISAMGSLDMDLPESLRRHSDAYLREPVDPETLVAVVGALIRARASERERTHAEERYRQMVESALEGIWTLDRDGTIVFLNQRMAEMLQYPAEDLIGRQVWEFSLEDERDRLKATFVERFTADASDRFDLPLRRRDGGVLWLSGSGKNSPKDGAAVWRTAVFIDITERKLAQDALLENHGRLELALGVAELGTWEVDPASGRVSASALSCEMFGLDSPRPNLEDWLARIHAEDRPGVRIAVSAAMSGAPYDMQFRVSSEGGGTRWIHAKARRVSDSQGRMTRLLGVAQDITQRVEAAAARERQRELFQAIIENIPVMLCIYDPMLRGFRLNREMARVLGWTTEDANSGDFMSMLYPDGPYRAEVRAYMQSLVPGWREWETTAKTGEKIPSEWANLRLSDDRLLGIGIDLRERKRVEASLRQSETELRARAAELEAIMRALPVAMFVARDPECRNVIGSRMTYELLRLPQGANVAESTQGNGSAAFRLESEGHEIAAGEWPAQKAASSGQAVRDYEFDVVFQDGTRRNLLGDAVPLFNEEATPSGAVAAFLDITDRKHAEERFRQSQKLESLGLLAGGIAHDFNNLLTAIMGNTSLVIEEAGPGPAKRLRGILKSAERAANLIRQLLAYSGKAEAAPREVDVAQAIGELRALMELSVPKSVRINLDFEQRLPLLKLDPGQLEQVLMNLVINAGEAIGEGNPGQIRVAASMAMVEGPFTDALGAEIPPGRFVRIEVSDTGGGIEKDVIGKLFDPFFTTKFSGRGLGLAAVAGIVRSNRGAITVESVRGKRTCFRVLLPVAPSHREIKEDPPGRQRSVVLVVDDDEAVRDFIAEVARMRGYRVLTACDGDEAVSICKRRRLDAVILDVVMPVRGAKVLLPQIKELQPHARILLTSGYSESDARRLCATYPDAAFVQKPYTADQIGEAIARALGGESAGSLRGRTPERAGAKRPRRKATPI